MSLPGNVLPPPPHTVGELSREKEEMGSVGRVALAGIARLADLVITAASVLVQRHSSSGISETVTSNLSPVDVPISPYPNSWGSNRRT